MRYNPLAESNNRLPRLCAWTQERLFAYADGELNAAERNTIQAHLDTCADCRQELALCRQAESVLLGARTAIPAPGDLRAGFYARLAEKEHAAPSRRLSPQWRLGLSACAAVLLFAALWRPMQAPITPETNLSEDTVAPPKSERNSESLANRAGVATQDAPDGGLKSKQTESGRTHLAFSKTRNKAGTEAVVEEKTPAPSVLSKEVADEIQATLTAPSHISQKASVRSRQPAFAAKSERSDQPAIAAFGYKTKESSERESRYYLGIQSDSARSDFVGGAKDGLKRTGAEMRFGAATGPNGEASHLYAWSMQSQNSQAREHTDRAFGEREASRDLGAASAAIVVASAPADREEASLEVVDEERGFRASVRHASRVESDEEGEVLTIESESDDMTDDEGSSQ